MPLLISLVTSGLEFQNVGGGNASLNDLTSKAKVEELAERVEELTK